MEVTLIRTGGIIPITKKASTETNWTENEVSELIDSSSANDAPGQMRDVTQYHLKLNEQTFTIDLEKVPLKYSEVFSKLKDDLQIVKPG